MKQLFAVSLIMAASMPVSHAAAADETSEAVLTIEAQPLASALREFSEQTGLQLGYASELVDGKKTRGVEGVEDPGLALDALLASSGLEHRFVNDETVVIRVAAASSDKEVSSDSGNVKTLAPVMNLAAVMMAQQLETNQPRPGTTAEENEERQAEGSPREDIEEIVVTGTNIRGVGQIASPVMTFDRQDFDRSGYATTEEFIRKIPQNFAAINVEAGAFQTTDADANANFFAGATMNLRGLGGDSTLTLLNGHRLAPSGTNGSITDISAIPLSAIERIEVLTDGASAIYGADAVAGVVNIILRRDFEGAETRVRYGSLAHSDSHEYQFSQVFGTHWDTGNVLLSYEYFRRDALRSADRPLAANSDLRRFGGDDFRSPRGNPGTIIAGGQTFAIPAGQDGTALTPADFIAGTSALHNQREGTFVFPRQERHSVFTSLSQRFSDRIEVFIDAHYTGRETTDRRLQDGDLTVPSTNAFFVDPTNFGLSSVTVRYNFVDDFGARVNVLPVDAWGGALGTRIDLSPEWQLELSGAYSRSESIADQDVPWRTAREAALADPNPATALNVFGDGSHTNPATLAQICCGVISSQVTTDILTTGGKVDGPLFELPAGAVRLAVGVEYREESFYHVQFDGAAVPPGTPPTEFLFGDSARDVRAVFAELLVPFVGGENRRRGIERLALSAAMRYEEYSDFGSATNPKFGLLWTPVPGVNVRTTYSTSFKAPLLTDLTDAFNAIYIPAGFFPVSTLVLLGNNPGLQPEESETWTAGFELRPSGLEGLNLEVGYFRTDHTNRIGLPVGNLLVPFTQPDLYAPILTFNPTEAQVRALVERPDYTGAPITGIDPVTGLVLLGGSPVEAILDDRTANLATVEASGIDFRLSYDRETPFGELGATIAGSYLFELEQAFLPTAPLIDIVSTVANPVDLRLRNSVHWSRNGLGITAYVNYVDDYTDNASIPARPIGSWTTVDLNVSFSTGERLRSIGLDNSVLALNATNLFDTEPPFVNNLRGIGYDPTNASVMGRLVTLQLTKTW